jgi:ubiquinone/menaquinone biosynthesis C-methylase UbiE
MGFYSNVVFPRIMTMMMSSEAMADQRRHTLSDVSGDVLEIGFGTGLNLPHYPTSLQALTAIDANPGMNGLAQKRIEAASIQVRHEVLDGQHLPMEDGSFDSVVSTWTLCSIPDVDRALDEVYRVLRPDGRFYFIEHGLSPDPDVQKWQRRIEPLNKVLACGCHLTRDFRQIIGARRFRFVELDNFYQPHEPRFAGYMYRGVAAKA